MSQTIDNQIVKMQFDNASFEQNAKQSMSTLEKLKAALKFEKVDMTPLQQAFNETEATATKAGFSIRDIWLKVASTIENEVATRIVDTGKKIANALTFEGVMDGFKEYELKMGSIQTIMNGTGESLATVNRYLDELNTYSDQTIYSFSDMTTNIGKFTNAGVKLNDAVNAIKGIANEAAISGANANQASHAMYNFAQALSAGYVKLIDWKSIENANMATKGFKEALLEVGSALGTTAKNADGYYEILTTNAKGKTMNDVVSGTKNFNDSLQYQWMTTEVLTQTLKLYANDVTRMTEIEKQAYEQELRNLGLNDEQIKRFEELGTKATAAASEIKTFSMLMDTLREAIGSGWAMTWQIIIGDFEQAKALWTDVGKVLGGIIDNMSDARNALLREGLTTGWEKFTSISDRAIPQSEKFRDVLVDLAVAQGKLTKEQADGIDSTNSLIDSFHDLGWITGDLLVEAVDDYYNILKKLSDDELADFGVNQTELMQLEQLNKELKDGTINADEFAEKMIKLGGRENVLEGLKNLFHSFLDVLRPIGEAFDTAFEPLSPQKIYDMTERFRKFTEQLKVSKDAADTIRTAFTLAFTGIKTVIDGVATAISGVSKLVLPLLNLFDALFGVVGKAIGAITGSDGALEAANKLGAVGDKIGTTYLNGMQKLAEWIDKVADAIRGIPDSVVFEGISNGVNTAISSLQRMWSEFTQLPVIQQMVSDFWSTIASIESRITPVVTAVSKAFEDMYKAVESKVTWDNVNATLTRVYDKVKDVIRFVKDLTDRIKNFFQDLKDGKDVIESFQKNFGNVIDKVNELKQNLEEFFTDLFAKGDELGKKFNLDEIANAIHEFVSNITPEQVTMLAIAGTFTLIAINMLKLSNAVTEAVESFTGIGRALRNVINSYVKKQKSIILQIAESIVIVAAALWTLSTIPKDKLQDASDAIVGITLCLGGLTLALTAVGILLEKLAGGQKLVELASGLVLIASSIMIVAGTMKVLETVDLEGIYSKLIVLGSIMALLVGLSAIMGKLDRFSRGSLTMVAVSASLFLAAKALGELGEIPTDRIESSLDGMLKIMLGLAAIVAASGKVGVFSAVGLLAVVLTISRLMPSIEEIVNYDYTRIQQGLDKNQEVLKKVAVIAGALTILGAIAGNRLKGAATAMLAISATFAVMLGVAKLAGMMDPRELSKGEQFLWSMAGIIALLELCSTKAKIGAFGGKNGGEGSKMFIRISAAMAILLGIAKLASMMDTKDIVKGELAVLGLTGIILAMIEVAKHAQKAEGVVKSIGSMLFALSLILAEVALLSIIPMENMLPALAVILAVMAALAGLALALAKHAQSFSNSSIKGIIGSCVTLAGALVAVVALGVIMTNLANLPIQNVATAAASIVAVIAAVSLLARSLGSIQGGFSWAQAQAAIEAVVIVAAVAAVIGILTDYISTNNIDPNTMVKAAASITAVLIGITPALAALSLFKKGAVDYAGMAEAALLAIGVLASIAVAIGALSVYGGENIMDAGVSIAMNLVAVSVPLAVLAAVGKFVKKDDFASMGVAVISAIGILASVGAAIWALSNFGNADTMMQSAQALAIGLVAISVPIAVLGAVGTLCQKANVGVMIGTVGSAVIGLAGIVAVLVAFSGFVDEAAIQKINDVMPSLCLAVAAVGVLALAISAAGLLAGGQAAIVGVGFLAITAAIAGLAEIVLAIAGLGLALEKITGFEGALITGLDMMVVIAGKIGEMAGALIGGFGVGISSQLDPIADNLISFSEKMITFSNNMANINAQAVTGCRNLAAAMVYICAAEFLDGIGRMIGFGRVGEVDFASLGVAMADFCDAIKDVPDDAVTKASTCSIIARRLSEIYSNLNLEGGILQGIIGQRQSMEQFADGLKALGKAIKMFCDEVQDIPENAAALAQRAADAARPIVELSNTLIRDGGIVQDIIGHRDLGQFGVKLAEFAGGLISFVEKLVSLENTASNYPDLIQKCADATTPLVDLANGLENMGGILAGIVGDNTLSKFGETLNPFITGLKGFVIEANDMASQVPNFVDLINQVTLATKGLIEMANSLDNMGGMGSWFSGDNTLAKFGETLPPFGEALAAYSSSLASADINLIGEANDCVKKLVELGKFASGVPADAFSGLKFALEDAAQMPVTAMTNEITVGTPGLITALGDMFTQMLNHVNSRKGPDKSAYLDYGLKLVTGIKEGITNNYQAEIIVAITTMVNVIKTNLSTNMAVTVWPMYGKNLVTGIKNGISTNVGDITSTLTTMINRIKTYLSNLMAVTVWVIYGKHIVDGIKTGINNGVSTLLTVLRNMDSKIKSTLNSVMSVDKFTRYGGNVTTGITRGINSSSSSAVRAAYNCGMQIANGLASGIRDYADDAVDAASDMVDRINAEIERVEQINSPSRVMYNYGKFIDQGLANGISDYAGEAVTSTNSMGQDIITTANSIISRIADALDGSMDMQPVIRPVLDTENIEYGAKKIGSLFTDQDLALAYTASGSIREVSQAKNAPQKVEIARESDEEGSTAPLTINMTVNAAEGQDEKAIAEYVKDKLVNEIYNKGAVFA